MLQALGLNPGEEAVYTALLALPAASVPELAGRSGLVTADVTRVLAALTERGLVTCVSASSFGRDCARYRLTPPSVALTPLLVEQRNALRSAEAAFSVLIEQYHSIGAHAAGGVVETVSGVDQVAHRFHQLQRGAQRELLVFLVGPPIAVARDAADASESSAIERGVDFRVVAARDYLDEHDLVQDVRAATTAGVGLRVADSLPIKMVVSDRQRAMVPLDLPESEGEPSAIVVHRSGLLTALVHLFESEWAKARPVYTTPTSVRAEPPDEEQPTPEEAEVLALLMAGISDKRVASQLGVSVRTVERRVRRLLNLAGVESRLQLGWHAARAGWLPE